MTYWQGKRVLVTGGHGFVGRALMEHLTRLPCGTVTAPSHQECDLTREENVKALISECRPQIVLHLAGRVGGIGVNARAPAQFFYDNLMMGTLIIDQSYRLGVERLVALGAGCGYPKFLEVPYREEDFWNGLPDENSIGYSMAKKNLVIQSWTYRKQYGFDSTVLLPANLYGPNDNFHLDNGHVVPALIRKFVEARDNNQAEVVVWGSGKASREFLFVDDTAEAMLRVAEFYHESGPLNLGTGQETSVRELTNIIAELTGFRGKIVWDSSKPDGQPRRFYDMGKFQNALGYIPTTGLRDGLAATIGWFEEHRDKFIQK